MYHLPHGSLPPYWVNIIKQRRRILCLYRSTRSEEHRYSLYSLNKYIHHELRAVKRAQWQEFCLGLEPKNTQRFWNHSKKLFRERAIPIQGFLDERNHRVITAADAMTEHARQYYSEAFREKETSSQNQDVAEFKEHLAEKLDELPSKPFIFSINDLHRSIRRLKTKTSSGHEKVSNKLLKSIPVSHYDFILQIFNALLIENTYPEHWKLSKMILLPKEKSAILHVHQTRPISLLPCLGKVYERCFLVYLRKWMKDNAVLPPEQSGFREHHSTTTRFVQFLQHISTGLLQQTASLVMYVDFTKAFDQLWHDGLLYKLHRMNCPHELVNFTIEYLKNRKYYIEMKHIPSAIFNIESSPSLCRRVETADQLPQDRVAIDTSTSSHSNPLSLFRTVNIPSREQPCTNTLAITWTNVSPSVNIARRCSKQSKRTLLSSNPSLDRKHHRQQRKSSSLRRQFNLICKWSTRFCRCYHSVQWKKSKRKIASCLVSFTID